MLEDGGSRRSNLDTTIRVHLYALDHLHAFFVGLSPGGATKSTLTTQLVVRQDFRMLTLFQLVPTCAIKNQKQEM